MNYIDIYITKVIVKPYKRDNGVWETIIETDSYGVKEVLTITGDKEYVKRYKKGYSWLG
jgi:hypothetical protein